MTTSKKLTFGFIFLSLTGLSLVVGANMWKSSLLVKKIIVGGNRIVDTNEILQLAHVESNQRMYDLDLMVIRRDVGSHYFLKDVVVERDLPSTLRISVAERSPVAMVNHEQINYLDEDGVVLPHSFSKELFDLPMLTGIPTGVSLAVGSTVLHHDVMEALNILSTAKAVNKELYYLISEIRLRQGGDLVLFTAEGGVPVIFGKGNAPSKLVRLETFWNTVVRHRGSEYLQYVDLRYEDQVVVRWAAPPKTARTL